MAKESAVMAVIRASRPKFRNPNDKTAFAVHSAFLAAGYSLIATGASAFSENPPTDGEEVGIEGWNDFEDSYAFLYLKSVKGVKKPILVKCLAIGDALVVDVLNLKEDHKEPLHIQINIKDHVSDGDNTSNYGEMYKNLKDLAESLNAGIFNKLEPKTLGSASGSRLRYPPVQVGGSDVFPGPGSGDFPNRGPGMGGSMLVGPNDPRFGVNPGLNFPGRDLVPPGGRYDPIGPPDVPGFGPESFIRNPPRRPGHGGGVHPDLEHFQGPDYI